MGKKSRYFQFTLLTSVLVLLFMYQNCADPHAFISKLGGDINGEPYEGYTPEPGGSEGQEPPPPSNGNEIPELISECETPEGEKAQIYYHQSRLTLVVQNQSVNLDAEDFVIDEAVDLKMRDGARVTHVYADGTDLLLSFQSGAKALFTCQ